MRTADDVVASVAVSLDGYISDQNGSVDFLSKYPMDDFDFDSFVDTIGAAIMGRLTYEDTIRLGWAFGALPVMVLTHKPALDVPEGMNVTFSSAPTADAIRRFSANTPKRLWVFGGGQVITEGIRAGAIDTLDIVVMPEALGAGTPLFTGAVGPLRPVSTESFVDGPLRLVYSATHQ